MFLVDTDQGRILNDAEVKGGLAAEQPYREWVHAGLMRLTDLPARDHVTVSHRSVLQRQKIFGYTEEELRILVTPMAAKGAEGIGSMGTDTPEAVLSERPRLIFDYFSQLFAQVTNPPLDAIREAVVTSLSSVIGPEQNLLAPGPRSCRQIVLPFPVLDNDDLAKLMGMNADGNLPGFASATISGLYDVAGGGEALAAAIERCRAETDEAIENGARVIMLSDRHSTADRAPIPSLLLTSAVHQHLVRQKSRTKVALVVESGDAREVHHIALLLGYGAGAVNPYLVLESAEDLSRHGLIGDVSPQKAIKNAVYALGKGVLKVMSKMGISTVGSYRAAQVFAVFGIDQPVLDEYFTGSTTRTGGSGLETIASDVAIRHALAFVPNPRALEHRGLEIGGQYQWRREGEIHLFNPETVYLLQHATRSKQQTVFRRYTEAVDELSRKGATLRGLFELRTDNARAFQLRRSSRRTEIVKRFVTGAMSYGSISVEAHETLAIAMNRLGGKSNTGEGGEDVDALLDPVRRSAIKQVASRPVRRDQRLPGERRGDPDQDGAGRQARRGRSAARQQGLPVDRPDPARHRGRRADLAPAAPRHLLHRGSQAADPRPAERQPAAASRSSWSPPPASAPSRPASPRRTPTRSSSPVMMAAPALRRSPRSSTPGSPGSSGSPRPSRRCD